ncbi:hypothetical protein FRC09_006431 [Ceratobasidium sp. 395]|nr:hypothetical protein FRC09_006431 [Ceratobasidium sp. 395]
MSDFKSLRSGSEIAYKDNGHETVTQESNLSGSSDATNPTKEPADNIDTEPLSKKRQVDLLDITARYFETEYDSKGHVELLHMAIKFKSQALEMAREEGMTMVMRLAHELAEMLYDRWVRLHDISDINQAIECLRHFMRLCPQPKTTTFAYLGCLLRIRFERLDHLADINQAIEYATLAVQLTPEGHPNMSRCLENLRCSLCERFERIGNEEDLDRALEYQVLCVQLTPDGVQHKPYQRHCLGVLLRLRHERNGDLADLDQAVECDTLAIQTMSEHDPNRTAVLVHLGCSLESRYRRIGDLSDLNKAVECHTMALRLCPTGHPDRSWALDKLGGSLMDRYVRLGSLQDMELAIQYQEFAAHSTPKSDKTAPDAILENLACLLQLRYEKFGNLADIDRAIEYQLQAIQQSQGGEADKAHSACNLGVSFWWRYMRLGNAVDMDQAIEHISLAVKLTPDGHPRKPEVLSYLGYCLISRFEDANNQADIDMAIHYLMRAVELTPDGHPSSPDHLLKLGKACWARFQYTRTRPDLLTVLNCFRKAANPPIVNPKYQMLGARSWVDLSLRLNLSPFEAYQTAFTILPHFVWLGQTFQARCDSILAISDLVSGAVAWAVSVGSYSLALEWLEQGRSVVWAQQLQTRTPFDELAAINLQLANRMRDVAAQLESAEPGSGATCPPVDSAFDQDLLGQRHDAALRWGQLLQEVRRIPGFENYMQPRKAHILKKAATRGPVVVINTHGTRCDALIIVPGRDDVTHVPLVRLAPEMLSRLRADVISLIGHRGDEDEPRGFKRHKSSESAQNKLYPLKVLWSDVVEPILDALQYTNRSSQDSELPHITWCATGVLSFLPLHAAGLYDGTPRNTFDLVVSSYTPTLAALLAPNHPVSMPHAGILAVGQDKTPGLTPLPKTVDELAVVGKHTAATGYRQLDGPIATVAATLNAMGQHSWVHLACHAIQNRADPRQSAFYLHDGKLTLETITKRAFKHKGLAFLSACQTATGDDALPDEAMHLAAGMLAAGYPTVIATMWSIADEDGPDVAEVVYGELLKDGKADHTKAAMALHSATKKLRGKVGAEAVARWAPFIHIGL